MREYDIRYGSLSNQVRKLEIPIPHDETSVCAVFVKTGPRNESSRREAGISHAIEHKVYRGTTKHTDREWALALDRLGSETNAYTDSEHTMFHIDGESRNAAKSIQLLSEILVNPTFPRTAMKRENGVLIGEMADTDVYDIAFDNFENLLYGKGPMGKPILGTKESVMNHTKRDLTKYMNKWYRGSNVLVVLAGKVNRMGKMIEKYFGEIPAGPVDNTPSQINYGKPGQKVRTEMTRQAYFVLGMPGVSLGDEDYYTFQVISTILGGSMESNRLYEKLRIKKGMVYDASTISETGSDSGYLAVQASVQPRLLNQVLDIVRSEVFNFAKTATKEEVIRAKARLRGNLLRELRNTLAVAEMIGVPTLFLDVVRQPKEMLAEIDKIKLTDVRRLATKLLDPDKSYLSVVGPFDENLKKVKWGSS